MSEKGVDYSMYLILCMYAFASLFIANSSSYFQSSAVSSWIYLSTNNEQQTSGTNIFSYYKLSDGCEYFNCMMRFRWRTYLALQSTFSHVREVHRPFMYLILCIFAYASLFIAHSLIVAFSIDCLPFSALLQLHNDQSPSTKSPSEAPTMTTIQKMIRGCDGAEYGYFGNSLAAKGDWAAIGAYGVSSYSGAVYLYKHDGNHWVFMQSLIASDGSAYNVFGYAVAISGTGHLVVGAHYDGDKGVDSGAVYLYTLSSTSNTWVDEQKIVASDGAAYERFGYAVAMSETGHLVVGAPYDDVMGVSTGAVYFYNLFDNTTNTWGNEQKIVASDGAAYDYFGYAVAMSGTGHLVVGAIYGEDKVSDSGAVYLFTHDSTSNTWGNEQKIVASDGAAYDLFGSSVAMSENGYLVVGAHYDDDKAGSVYLFTHDSTSNTWGNEQKIVASDGAAYAWYGYAVTISESGHLVVGAPDFYNSGAVYLYTLDSTSNTWGDEQKIVASDGDSYDLFGWSVAMSETGHIVVGAIYDDTGSVYALGVGVRMSF
jgi:hypothetical protein